MKRILIATISAMLCFAAAGCKATDNRQAADTPVNSPSVTETQGEITDAISQAADTSEPAASIAPLLDLWDEDLILPNSSFDGLEAPANYSPSDEDRNTMEKMMSILSVTNDALSELEQLKQDDPELLDSKAPVTALMVDIKNAHDEGRALEYPDELEQFHALYQSVLVLNYNAADLMAQAMDADDTALSDEAMALFDRGQLQYDKLIDYAQIILEK